MKKFLNHFFTIVFLLLLNINNLSAQNFCGQDIALQNQIQYAGTLNNIYNGFEACGNSYFSYDAVHSFTSESAGTATISFEENLFSGFDLLILDGCNADISSCIFSAYSDEDLAAVLSYVRNSWGNEASVITAEQVATVRQKYLPLKKALTREQIDTLPAKAEEILSSAGS